MSLINKFQEIFQHNFNAVANRGKSQKAEFQTGNNKGIILLNAAAIKLMDLGSKDRILVFDIMKDAKSMQDRFFITKGFIYKSKPYGTKVNSQGGFMDSAFYNLLLYNDIQAEFCTNEDLLRKGLYVLRNTAKRKDVLTPVKRVSGDVELYTETLNDGTVLSKFSVADGMPQQAVYKLTNLVWNDNPLIEL